MQAQLQQAGVKRAGDTKNRGEKRKPEEGGKRDQVKQRIRVNLKLLGRRALEV